MEWDVHLTPTTRAERAPLFSFYTLHPLKGNLEIKVEAGSHERRLMLILLHLESDRTLKIIRKSLVSSLNRKYTHTIRTTEGSFLLLAQEVLWSERWCRQMVEVFKVLMADKVTLFCLFRFLWSAELRQIRSGIIFQFLALPRCGELIWPKPTCSRCTMGRSGTTVRGKPQVCTEYQKPFLYFHTNGRENKWIALEFYTEKSCLNSSLRCL